MKVFSTVFVTEYEDEVTYKERSFVEWLLNKPRENERVERIFSGRKVSEKKYDTVEELLREFVKTKVKGQSSNLCGTQEYDLFFWLTKGKNKIAVQASAHGEDNTVKTLQDLHGLFGSKQVIDGKSYQIVFNVTDAQKHSEIAKKDK